MRVAIAGLGNVGAAVLRLLHTNAAVIAARGQAIEVVAVSTRDKNKARACDAIEIDWHDDPRELATRSDIDVVVETIGGVEGVALDVAKAVLANGKHLVTANKNMIAAHGVELARLAESNGLQLSFEAAVCGGVPVVKVLREGLAANRITSVRGIINGTCNYILTRMQEGGIDFAAALAEAREKGYAEADPSADIDGIDSACKLALLAALVFGVAPNIEAVFVEGIRHVTLADTQDANARGGCLKLLGIATRTEAGIVQRVQPVFVPLSENLARVAGAANGVEITGDFVGDIFLQGQGAGGNATASAIVADLIDIARGHRGAAFGVAAADLA